MHFLDPNLMLADENLIDGITTGRDCSETLLWGFLTVFLGSVYEVQERIFGIKNVIINDVVVTIEHLVNFCHVALRRKVFFIPLTDCKNGVEEIWEQHLLAFYWFDWLHIQLLEMSW